jgi:glycosyltransferase involved in cell wall biosynthesis
MTRHAIGQRLRIAVLTRSFTPLGGAERYAMALAEQFAPRHEVHVFAQHFGARLPKMICHRVPCYFTRPRWLNQLWFALYTWWRTRSGFDIVHSHENTWHGNIQTVHVQPVRLGLVAGRQGVRRWIRCLQVATSPRLWVYSALEEARLQPRPGRVVIAVSQTLRDHIAASYPRLPAPGHVLPPGVTPPVLIDDRSATRQTLGLAEDSCMLLFIACDPEKKGLGALLDALRVLPPHVNLVVVGKIDPTFEHRAAAGGLAARVHFVGTLLDPGPMYRAADMLVHPTLEDSFALVVLEAMAYGVPVVVSDRRHCGIAAAFSDTREALLLKDPRDSRAIAAAIRCLLYDPALRARLAAAGPRFAQRHDWALVAAQQERIYHEAVAAAVTEDAVGAHTA